MVTLTVASSVFFYLQYRDTQSRLAEAQKSDDTRLVERIGKLVDLPKGEVPTIATVSEVEKLRSQPFFAKAENGDKILIFQISKKAVLYRPSTDKVIEIGPIAVDQNTSSSSGTLSPLTGQVGVEKPMASAEVTIKAKVTIYNGTSTKGLAKEVQDKLKVKFSEFDFVGVGNTKGDFSKTVVVDLGGKNATAAKTISGEVKGQVVDKLPEGETRPDSNILVILGSDYAQ